MKEHEPLSPASMPQLKGREAKRTRFVYVRGMLQLGLPWAVVVAVVISSWRSIPLGLSLVVAVPLGLLGGYLWGDFLWPRYERNLRERQAESSRRL